MRFSLDFDNTRQYSRSQSASQIRSLLPRYVNYISIAPLDQSLNGKIAYKGHRTLTVAEHYLKLADTDTQKGSP